MMVKFFLLILIIVGYVVFRIYKKKKLENIDFLSAVKNEVLRLIEVLIQKSYVKSISNRKKHIVKPPRSKLYKLMLNIYNYLESAFHFGIYFELFLVVIFLVYIIYYALSFVFIKSIILAFLIAVALMVGTISIMIAIARAKIDSRNHKIMDAIDLLSSYASKGINYAIEENLRYIDPELQPIFKKFLIKRKEYTYNLKELLNELNEELGPLANSFIEKVYLYERFKEEGMENIFKDVTDEIAAIREVNFEKTLVFEKINNEFLYRVIFIIGIGVFVMTRQVLREFLLQSLLGKIIITITICALFIAFAINQILQSDIISN